MPKAKPAKSPRKCGACGQPGHNRQSCPEQPYQAPSISDEELKEIQFTIVELLEGGNFLETAASVAGITPAKCRQWLRLGREPESPFAEFRKEVLRALAASEAEALKIITKAAANGNVKAAIQWLEKRHPTRWNVDVKREVANQLNGILDRIEALESTIGEEAVTLVIEAVLDGDRSGEIDQEAEDRDG